MVVAVAMIRRAFTLIEVLASVLVLNIALMAAAGMVLYGLAMARNALARSIGMATARTMLADPTPLPTDPASTPGGPTASGYLNGLWVERRESAPTPLEGAAGRLVAVTVTVDVYEASGGRCVASATRRVLRRLPP